MRTSASALLPSEPSHTLYIFWPCVLRTVSSLDVLHVCRESFGEDPYHMQRLVVEYVTGAQNNSRGVPYDGSHSAPPLLTGMCCKHVAAYDVEDSRYTFNASVDKRNLWESYLPAFKGCISEVRYTLFLPISAHQNTSALCSSDLLHLPRLRRQRLRM